MGKEGLREERQGPAKQDRMTIPNRKYSAFMSLQFSSQGKARLILGLLSALSGSQAIFASTPLDKCDSFTVSAAQSKSSSVASYLIKLDGRLTPRQRASLEKLGAKVKQSYSLVDYVAVDVQKKNLVALAKLPFVKRVSSDETIKKNDEFTVEHSFANFAFEKYRLTGDGVTVAVIDSGMTDADDLKDPKSGKSRILASVNFVPHTSSTADQCGHGTHVSGIVAGNGADSTGPKFYRTFYGVARNADLVNVRVLDATGQTKVTTLISALQWVVDHKDRYNIRVVNMSMGHSVGESYKTDPLCQAVEMAWKAGIVVVVAAGNDGRVLPLALKSKSDNEGYGAAYGSIASPGNDPYVITVGAMKSTNGDRRADTVATYSSRGPSRLDFVLKPDIMAPGNKVVSLRKPLSFLELTSPNNAMPLSGYCSRPTLLGSSDYYVLSGTSMATPVVAGAAALLLQDEPDLNPDTVKARLMMTADKWEDNGGDGDACTYGAVYLNIKSALACNLKARKPALSPTLVRTDNGVQIDDDSLSGKGGLWGSGVTDFRAVWGNRALWGSNNLAGNRALWGTSVWSDRALWGSDVFSIGLGPIVLNGD